ncbi:Actin-related protein 2/3 complex subunit 3 [Dendrobium catenatum]|uniref:Actin-related protein 2/3 complex subunit 3 n=1 Tax=Dendrobium catenatum TaxID=906689 RepID=A0A2I0W068_9ASPA|nr:Actin-related protein 2/3 complex subunit 3 [Dendrobium catenatum]
MKTCTATMSKDTYHTRSSSLVGRLSSPNFPQTGDMSGCCRNFHRNVYHSSFVDEEGVTKACGCPLLPLKTHIKGPAPVSDQDKIDIVDESISFFRANVFFRNFDIRSSADKLLIYLTFYINLALKRLEGCRTLAIGTKAIISLGLENVPVPGEQGFPFPGLFTFPQSPQEAGITYMLLL